MPYGDIYLVNIGSDDGLLPDGTKPLPEPMQINHQWSLVVFPLGQFCSKCMQDEFENYILNITVKSPRGPWIKVALMTVCHFILYTFFMFPPQKLKK